MKPKTKGRQRRGEHEGEEQPSTGTVNPPPALGKLDSKPTGQLHKLNRQTFTTSREMEYFNEKELTLQTGHAVKFWPSVLLKELVDNALDAAEDAGIPPIIEVTLSDDGLTVADNGPGIAAKVVKRILDLSSKTSSKDFYLAPTRGAQGNALKTVLAIPYVLSGNVLGRLEIESRGVKHEVTVTVNRIKQQPEIVHIQTPSVVKIGTLVRVSSGDRASSLNPLGVESEARFLPQLANYDLLNPHLSLRFEGGIKRRSEAANAAWVKWKPSDPISPLWYELEQFIGLIAAHISAEQDGGPVRFVREFIADFRGLKSTTVRKDILTPLSLTGSKLSELVKDGDVDRDLAGALLNAMKAMSREVKPQALGIIGEEHIRSRFLSRDCNESSFRYKKTVGVDSHARPFVIEVAFALFEDKYNDCDLVTGLNFSPCIRNPFGELSGWLANNYIESDTPCLVLVHLIAPHLEYSDRGKSSVQLLPEVADAITAAVDSVTGKYAKIEKAKIRSANQGNRAMERYLTSTQQKERSIKAIVYENLPAVYASVSQAGDYPAIVRQIYYGCRPLVLEELTDKPDLGSNYITQTLVPDFMEENPDICADWDVVFDARGHFAEPHTNVTLGLGTLEVREYLDSFSMPSGLQDKAPQFSALFPTVGPAGRFSNILFIEKEGFMPLLQKAEISTRFDLAIMSSKGIGSTATRRLMESLSGVRIFTLHDFDKAGFSIVGTLQRDTRRYRFKNPPEIIDLGIRLEDVRRLKLASEPFAIKPNAAVNLRENGATEDEIKFLLGDGDGRGQRVELNTMTSPQLITWLEGKLKKHGVKKFVPDDGVLETAFRRATLINKLNAEIEKEFPKLRTEAEQVEVPKNLRAMVQAYLKQNPGAAWDAPLAEIANTIRTAA